MNRYSKPVNLRRRGFLSLAVMLVCLWIAAIAPVFASEGEAAKSSAVQAVENRTRVYDYASLFSVSEQLDLQRLLQSSSEQIGVDLVVATVNWNTGKTQKGFARDFLLDQGFGVGEGRESILFLIDMNERQFTVFEYNDYAEGYVLTDDEVDYILADCRSSMKAGRYAAAATIFVEKAIYYEGVDIGRNYAEGSRNIISRLSDFQKWLISIGIGCLVGGIITAIAIWLRNNDSTVPASWYSNEPLKVLRRVDRFTHTTKVVHYYSESSGGHSGGSSGGSSGGGHGGSSSF